VNEGSKLRENGTFTAIQGKLPRRAGVEDCVKKKGKEGAHSRNERIGQKEKEKKLNKLGSTKGSREKLLEGCSQPGAKKRPGKMEGERAVCHILEDVGGLIAMRKGKGNLGGTAKKRGKGVGRFTKRPKIYKCPKMSQSERGRGRTK